MSYIELAAHDSHEHILELKNFKKPYHCDGCKMQGFGPRFRCEPCDYDLHQYCMFPADFTCHEFFKSSEFKFLERRPDHCNKSNCKDHTRHCDACGKPVQGFVYHCEEKGWNLHPCCKNLENELEIAGVKFELKNEVKSKCIWCTEKKLSGTKKNIRGWSYVSECQDYHFHVYCVAEMVLETWQKGGGGDNNGDNCLALENLDLRGLAKKNRKGGDQSNKYWRILGIFLKTIAAILLGDPTVLLVDGFCGALNIKFN